MIAEGAFDSEGSRRSAVSRTSTTENENGWINGLRRSKTTDTLTSVDNIHKLHSSATLIGMAIDLEREDIDTTSDLRLHMHRILASARFNLFIGLLIVANTISMAVEIDMHPTARSDDALLSYWHVTSLPQYVFDGFEAFLFVVFSVELAMRILVRGCPVFKDVSTHIDFVALFPVVLELGFNLQSGKHLMVLRVVRLLKLCRLLRLIRMFKELTVLVSAFAGALRSLTWIVVLLVIVVFCSAILCTTLIGHNDDYLADNPRMLHYVAEMDDAHIRRYWSSILRSVATLFQIFTLDDWTKAVRPIVETHLPWMCGFFVAFIFITTYGLLNVLMGIILDHTVKATQEVEVERERLLSDHYKQIILATTHLFSLIDTDGNGLLSAEELASFLESHDIQKMLEKHMKTLGLKIDYIELAEAIVHMIEEWYGQEIEDDRAAVSLEEFVGAASASTGMAKSRDLWSEYRLQDTAWLDIGDMSESLELLELKVDVHTSVMRDGFDRVAQLIAPSSPSRQVGSQDCSARRTWRKGHSGGYPSSLLPPEAAWSLDREDLAPAPPAPPPGLPPCHTVTKIPPPPEGSPSRVWTGFSDVSSVSLSSDSFDTGMSCAGPAASHISNGVLCPIRLRLDARDSKPQSRSPGPLSLVVSRLDADQQTLSSPTSPSGYATSPVKYAFERDGCRLHTDPSLMPTDVGSPSSVLSHRSTRRAQTRHSTDVSSPDSPKSSTATPLELQRRSFERSGTRQLTKVLSDLDQDCTFRESGTREAVQNYVEARRLKSASAVGRRRGMTLPSRMVFPGALQPEGPSDSSPC